MLLVMCMGHTYLYLLHTYIRSDQVYAEITKKSITRTRTFCEPGEVFSPVGVEGGSGDGGLPSVGESN